MHDDIQVNYTLITKVVFSVHFRKSEKTVSKYCFQQLSDFLKKLLYLMVKCKYLALYYIYIYIYIDRYIYILYICIYHISYFFYLTVLVAELNLCAGPICGTPPLDYLLCMYKLSITGLLVLQVKESRNVYIAFFKVVVRLNYMYLNLINLSSRHNLPINNNNQ